jgi:hypothetical protein
MTSRFVGAVAVAFAALGIVAGTAGANGNHGASGYQSGNSTVHSPVGGTCNAAFSTPAGYTSESYTTFFLGYPIYFCGQA